MKLIEYNSREALFAALAQTLAQELRAALQDGHATLVVPGGSTPGPVFDILAQTGLEWPRVRVMLSDERFVPRSSPRSNTRLLRERLLVGQAAQAWLVPLYAAAEQPEDVLDHLLPPIRAALPITSLLLGMGEDMHIASLFPGADQLQRAMAPDAPELLAMRAPGAPEARLSLSAPVLQAARQAHVVLTGPEKRHALAQAQKLRDPMQAPVCAIMDNAIFHWAI